ncbi:MAG: hypothetical protein IJX36_09350 [Thermoguttaceae bacterium]|nr:hypothetical protein [Thermoguttaceae bacterium]
MTRTLSKSAWNGLTLSDAKFCLKAGGFGRAKVSNRRFCLRNLLSILALGTSTLFATGCRSTEFFHKAPKPEPTAFATSQTKQIEGVRAKGQKLTFAFDGVPLRAALEEISDVGGCEVFCSAEVANQPVSGYFALRDVADLVPLLAKTNGLQCVETRGAFYLTADVNDATAMVPRVYRLPPGEPNRLQKALESVLSKEGELTITGSSVVVYDNLDVQDSVAQLVDALTHNQSSTYLCDVYFLRLKYNDYVNLSADLEINSSLDLLEGGFDFDDLLSLYASGDATNGRNRVDQRPALLLSDGRETTLSVGSEIVREKTQVSAEGYSSTSGYERFQDGLELRLTPHKLSAGRVALDVDLSISTFDQSEKSGVETIPKSDKTELIAQGLVLTDGKLSYLGSIDRRDESKGLGVFSFSQTRNSDVLTVWGRVREVKN